MLRKLLCGIIISALAININYAEAKAKWWKSATRTNDSAFFQNLCNVLNLENLEKYYRTFEKQSMDWKNFASLAKKKEIELYMNLYSKYSSEFSRSAVEFYEILKMEGSVNDIPLYDDISRKHKNAMRKSVYAALQSLSAAIKSQHDTMKGMIQKAEKTLAHGKYTKGDQQLIDSHIQSIAYNIRKEKTVVQQYNEIVKRLAAVCKLLHVSKTSFNNINSRALNTALQYKDAAQPISGPGQFTNTNQQVPYDSNLQPVPYFEPYRQAEEPHAVIFEQFPDSHER